MDPSAGEDAYRPELAAAASSRFVMITGCSGGGKSSLLAELARRGYRTFAEPGRQIFKEQTLIDGPALPARDGVLFGELCISRTINRMVEAAAAEDFAFFDRGLIDPFSHWARLGMEAPAHWTEAAKRFRFHRKVFVAPPWPEIFENDSERRHSFEDAIGDYPVLLQIYRDFSYETIILPKIAVSARADLVLNTLK